MNEENDLTESKCDSIDTRTGKQAPAEISTARVKKIFSEISDRYELFNAVSSMGTYKLWLSGMMKQINVTHDDRVLDVAGGTGDVTFAIAKSKHPASIVCSDLVDEMLDVARRHYLDGDGCGVPIDFQVVDAQSMPFEDESFDVVTMAYGIRNMPQREKALSEVYRVLRRGGTFACLEFSTPTSKSFNALYSVYLKKMIPFWGDKLTGKKDDFVYLSNSIQAFPNQRGFAKMLIDAGFTRVTWKNYSGGIAAVHIAKKP